MAAERGGDVVDRHRPAADGGQDVLLETGRGGDLALLFEGRDDLGARPEKAADLPELDRAQGLGPDLGRRPDDRVEVDAVGPDPVRRPLEGPEVGRGVVRPLDEHDLEPDPAREPFSEGDQTVEDLVGPERRMRPVDPAELGRRRGVQGGDDDVGLGQVVADVLPQ